MESKQGSQPLKMSVGLTRRREGAKARRKSGHGAHIGASPRRTPGSMGGVKEYRSPFTLQTSNFELRTSQGSREDAKTRRKSGCRVCIGASLRHAGVHGWANRDVSREDAKARRKSGYGAPNGASPRRTPGSMGGVKEYRSPFTLQTSNFELRTSQGSREDAKTRRKSGCRVCIGASLRHAGVHGWANRDVSREDAKARRKAAHGAHIGASSRAEARDLRTPLVYFPSSGLQWQDVPSKESLITPHVRESGVRWRWVRRRVLSASRITLLCKIFHKRPSQVPA